MSLRSIVSSVIRRFSRVERRDYPAGLSIPPGTVIAGVQVTEATALNFTAVFAAINCLATDIASLPLRVMQRQDDGSKRVAKDHPLTYLLRYAPNSDQDSFRFRQAQCGHIFGWGNSFAEIVRDSWTGSIRGFSLLNPASTKPMRLRDTRLYYETRDDLSGATRKLHPENVLHLAGLGFDGIEGYSPIRLARQAVGLGIAAEEFGASLFGNGAIPKGILTTPKRLTELAVKNLRESFSRVHQGSKFANNLAILEDGVEWKNTSIPPEDAQFLATRAFQVIEIARLYRLPPHKIGDYSQAHLSNVEEANLDYITSVLVGWLESIEAQLVFKLLSEQEVRNGYFIAHDLRNLLRGNMTARSTYYKNLREQGCVTANEIRGWEDLNPFSDAEGGNKPIVQMNYTTLEKVGTVPAAPVARHEN